MKHRIILILFLLPIIGRAQLEVKKNGNLLMGNTDSITLIIDGNLVETQKIILP